MKHFHKILPHPVLQDYIHCYLTFESDKLKMVSTPYNILPDGAHELVINYVDEEQEPSLLISNLSVIKSLEIKKKIGLFIIVFKPFGLNILTKFPVWDFANKITPVNLISLELNELSDQLINAKNNLERVQISNKFLLNKIRYYNNPLHHSQSKNYW